MSSRQAASRVLGASLTQPEAPRVDIKFWVFTKRSQVTTESGVKIVRVGEPRPIFGVSAILTQYTYFDDRVWATVSSPFPLGEAFIEDYDYESDSDLDDEDGNYNEETTGERRSPFPVADTKKENNSKDESPSSDSDESTEEEATVPEVTAVSEAAEAVHDSLDGEKPSSAPLQLVSSAFLVT
ncbi:hypothetical protein EIP86_003393 [Pleurotus ostreatoroseus]|nr:hypothetical protein EIP86_003393 [Pleurotus ostreatoroseus]